MKNLNLLFKTIFSFTIVFSLLLTLGCTDQESKSEEEMKNLVDKLEHIQNSGDFSNINEIFSPNLIWHDAFFIEHHGIEPFKKFLISLHDRFPDSHHESKLLIVKDNMIVWKFVHTGTHSKAPFIGKKVDSPVVLILKVENGKIVEMDDFHNEVPGLKKLGYTITPPTFEEKE